MITQKVKTARKIKSSRTDRKALSQYISSNRQEREQVMLVPIIGLASSETQTPAHIAALALGHISGCAVHFSQHENSWGFARLQKTNVNIFLLNCPSAVIAANFFRY